MTKGFLGVESGTDGVHRRKMFVNETRRLNKAREFFKASAVLTLRELV